MKKRIIILIALVTSFSFNACSNDDEIVFVAQQPESIAFTNTFAASYLLSQDSFAEIAQEITWKTVDYGLSLNENYSIQASTTETFDLPIELGSTAETKLAITTEQLWNFAEEAGLDNDPATTEIPNEGTFYLRLVASAGTQGEMPVISETQIITIILEESTSKVLTYFYLVGDVTASGWTNTADSNNTPLFIDPANANIYHFKGRLAGSPSTEGFKLLNTLGQWQPQWGVDANGNLSNSDILGKDPQAFVVTEDAYYNFTMNTDAMTFSIEKIDASAATTYATIGLIGSATPTGWDSDTDLTQSAFNPHIWYLENVSLIDGEIKFRADDAWTVSWGSDTPLTGQGTLGGPNIPAEAGVYTIWFNDLDGRYLLIPQE